MLNFIKYEKTKEIYMKMRKERNNKTWNEIINGKGNTFGKKRVK